MQPDAEIIVSNDGSTDIPRRCAQAVTSAIRPLRPWRSSVAPTLLIIFKTATLHAPLKLFAPAAVIFFVMGLGWYGYTFTSAHHLSLISVALWCAAVIIFLIGLISEQITSLTYKCDF